MTDDIVEIAAKVIYANGYDEERSERHYATARAVLREVTPLIRAAALEEVVQVIVHSQHIGINATVELVRAVRKLKEQP